MTHTLHRIGDAESLQNDICIMAFPHKGINYEGSKPHLQWFFQEAHDCGAVNLGMVICGSMITFSLAEVIEKVKDGRGAFTVFDDLDKATLFLSKVKEKKCGISITVSTLWDLALAMSEKVGVKPHSVNRSIGVFGDTNLLPPEGIQRITSMCGHAQVSPLLVEQVMEDVNSGRMTAREGAIKLAKPCICGFFNVTRAEKLLDFVK